MSELNIHLNKNQVKRVIKGNNSGNERYNRTNDSLPSESSSDFEFKWKPRNNNAIVAKITEKLGSSGLLSLSNINVYNAATNRKK